MGTAGTVTGRERTLIIVPAYDEEETIRQVLLELRRAAPECDRLVVTDGSRDRTPEVVDSLGERRLGLLCNLGYGRALQAGFRYALAAGYDIVVTMDADGQHDPADVPRLTRALRETDADLVIGSRFLGREPLPSSRGRRLGQQAFSLLSSLMVGRRLRDTTSGLRAMRAPACRVLADGTFLDFHTEALVRLALSGYRLTEIPVTMRRRAHGRSMHRWTSAVHYPLKTLLLTLVATVDVLLRRREPLDGEGERGTERIRRSGGVS